MEHPPQPMPAEITHHRAALAFGICLDRTCRCRRSALPGFTSAMPRISDSCVTSISRAALAVRRARDEHARGVAVPAVQDRGDVDVQDIAVLQRLRARDTVADHMVDRDARPISDSRDSPACAGVGIVLGDELVDRALQFFGAQRPARRAGRSCRASPPPAVRHGASLRNPPLSVQPDAFGCAVDGVSHLAL